MLSGFLKAPAVHGAATAVHIFAGIFWLGWVVFMFGILPPVVAEMPEGETSRLRRRLRKRVRRIVSWIIPALILTGLYNIWYHGLLDARRLFDTARGHRMLAKLGAAGLHFWGVYYAAPVLPRIADREDGSRGSVDCHHKSEPLVRRISAALHAVAFVSGLPATVLGVSLGTCFAKKQG